MGATLSLALVLWLASSYVEYKIIKSSPHLARYFHGVGGIVISIVISLAIGYMLAPAAGIAVQLAAMLGLATNEFTFKLYSFLERTNDRRRETVTKVTSFKTSHPTVYSEAVEGIKAGFKVIGAIFLVIVWLFGLPIRITRWTQAGYSRLRSSFNRLIPAR